MVERDGGKKIIQQIPQDFAPFEWVDQSNWKQTANIPVQLANLDICGSRLVYAEFLATDDTGTVLRLRAGGTTEESAKRRLIALMVNQLENTAPTDSEYAQEQNRILSEYFQQER